MMTRAFYSMNEMAGEAINVENPKAFFVSPKNVPGKIFNDEIFRCSFLFFVM
jgi:hypothetical protein